MLQKRVTLSLSVLLIVIFTAFISYKDLLTIKNTVDMRNGPGSYYPLVLRLNSGAEVSEVDKQQQWLKVKAEDKEGWIPERSVYVESSERIGPDQDEVIPSAQAAFEELDNTEGDSTDSPYASPAQVAAAVKGFATDFTSAKTGQQESILLNDFNNFVDAQQYRAFRQKRLKNWTWEQAQQRFAINPDEAPALRPSQEQAGWGIANVIAQRGLLQKPKLQQYLTNLALVLAENSHRYEAPLHVYILDTIEISGYASPNGAIFVSRGALQIMNNETELAFFLAHELSHITQSHGLKESQMRKEKIKADKGFGELEKELDQSEGKYEEVEEDLSQLANEMYEYTVKDRLEEYEFSADNWGIIYMYRAGYHPAKALSLLNRIRDHQGDFEDKIGHAKWQGTSLSDRILRINSQVAELDIPQGFGHNFRQEFQQKISSLAE